MTAAHSFDAPSSLAMKQEKDDCSNDSAEKDDDRESDDEDEDDGESSPLAQPSILDKDSIELADPTDEFLRLTAMVRRVYFSYLHKSVIGNYNTCCRTKDREVTRSELKEFASRMELCAVKASLEASLYRRTMLKMISDIKSSTSMSRAHKKLSMFLQRPPRKVNVAVQTGDNSDFRDIRNSDSSHMIRDVGTQSAIVTSKFNENKPKTEPEVDRNNGVTESLKKESSLFMEESRIRLKCSRESRETWKTETKREDGAPATLNDTNVKNGSSDVPSIMTQKSEIETLEDEQEIFGNEDAIIEPPLRNEEDASQDSLMQHLEDMFCESDDSSDLTTLIEKHTGVTKANVDLEIVKMCPLEPPIARSNCTVKQVPEKGLENNADTSATSNKRKLSIGNYKKMKKRAMGEPETPPHEETIEEKTNRKIRDIWFVERVHQVSKLEAKMMELSVNNYRKHGRLCAKFIELFGDPDEEDTMPSSPIRIEEHLTACKERIAPWVVKYLMPYYTSRVIRNRALFKVVAKHIADMLIIENTFPEEDCVATCVKRYFENKTCIKAESDIYI